MSFQVSYLVYKYVGGAKAQAVFAETERSFGHVVASVGFRLKTSKIQEYYLLVSKEEHSEKFVQVTSTPVTGGLYKFSEIELRQQHVQVCAFASLKRWKLLAEIVAWKLYDSVSKRRIVTSRRSALLTLQIFLFIIYLFIAWFYIFFTFVCQVC
eukprot:TRINITY_DN2370_c0_g1_i1.p4 TRINITY_DN2370_c0_g1~~TRINITY_DN2370_c0_g1_i1.p4  ORF type:complete len:154 (-),score=12.78 TRINITY_DN2370_c0_g1_i1:2602-3063(-)